jgi:hypothetical protein
LRFKVGEFIQYGERTRILYINRRLDAGVRLLNALETIHLCEGRERCTQAGRRDIENGSSHAQNPHTRLKSTAASGKNSYLTFVIEILEQLAQLRRMEQDLQFIPKLC